MKVIITPIYRHIQNNLANWSHGHVNGAHGWKCDICTYIFLLSKLISAALVTKPLGACYALLFRVQWFDPHMGRYFFHF